MTGREDEVTQGRDPPASGHGVAVGPVPLTVLNPVLDAWTE